MATDGSCASTPASPPRHALHSSLRMLLANANLSPTSPRYGKISSPMSCLALNLSGLSTGDNGGTPKRRLSLSSVDSPTGMTPASRTSDDGTFTESPGFTRSPTVEMSLSWLAHEYNKDRPSSYGRSRSLPFRKLQNLPIPALRLSPVDFDLSDDDDGADDVTGIANCKHTPDSLNLDSSGCSLSSDESATGMVNMRDARGADVDVEASTASDAFTNRRDEIMKDAISDSVSRSLDFCLLDDTMDASLDLKDTSVDLLDESDSQGIVADMDNSYVCYSSRAADRGGKVDRKRDAARYTRRDYSDTSETSDLDGSFTSLTFKSHSFASPDFKPNGALDDEGSHDSGVSMDKDRDYDDVFRFPPPLNVAPRRVRLISEETCSPHKYSPIKAPCVARSSPPGFNNSFSLSTLAKSPSESSPVSLKTSPLTGTAPLAGGDSNDEDGFIDEIDNDLEGMAEACLPDSFSSLFSAPLIHPGSCDPAEKKTRVCRKLLDRSMSIQECRSRSQKRANNEGDTTPVQSKRHRCSVTSDSAITSHTQLPRPKTSLKRCSSESEAIIKSVLNKVTEDTNLIGDGSKPFLLPTIRGRHTDLKCISPDTLAAVLTDPPGDIERCIVVDCRYPYEYSAGHIRGSRNLYQKQDIMDQLMRDPIQASHPHRRIIFVFHCEFSAERAPTLSRFLRNKDRDTNKDNYPDLYYPELYLLDGGYKAFFEQHPEMCDPQSYKPMLHEDHREDLRMCRVKTRSWTDDKTRTSLRLKF